MPTRCSVLTTEPDCTQRPTSYLEPRPLTSSGIFACAASATRSEISRDVAGAWKPRRRFPVTGVLALRAVTEGAEQGPGVGEVEAALAENFLTSILIVVLGRGSDHIRRHGVWRDLSVIYHQVDGTYARRRAEIGAHQIEGLLIEACLSSERQIFRRLQIKAAHIVGRCGAEAAVLVEGVLAGELIALA